MALTSANSPVCSYSFSSRPTVRMQLRLSLLLVAFVLASLNVVFADSASTTKLTVLLGAASKARSLIVLNSNFHVAANNSVFSGAITEEATTGDWVIKTFELDSSSLESGVVLVVSAKRRSSGFVFNSEWENKRYRIPISRDLLVNSRGAIAIEFIKSDRLHKSVAEFRVTSFDDYVELQQIRSIEANDSKFAAALAAGLQSYSKGLQENSQKNKTMAVYPTLPGSSIRDYNKPGFIITNSN